MITICERNLTLSSSFPRFLSDLFFSCSHYRNMPLNYYQSKMLRELSPANISNTNFQMRKWCICVQLSSLGWEWNSSQCSLLSLYIEVYLKDLKKIRWYIFLFISNSLYFLIFLIIQLGEVFKLERFTLKAVLGLRPAGHWVEKKQK